MTRKTRSSWPPCLSQGGLYKVSWRGKRQRNVHFLIGQGEMAEKIILIHRNVSTPSLSSKIARLLRKIRETENSTGMAMWVPASSHTTSTTRNWASCDGNAWSCSDRAEEETVDMYRYMPLYPPSLIARIPKFRRDEKLAGNANEILTRKSLYASAVSKGDDAVAPAPFCCRSFSSNLANSCIAISSSWSMTCVTPLTSSIYSQSVSTCPLYINVES